MMINEYCLGNSISVVDVRDENWKMVYELIDSKRDRTVTIEIWKGGGRCYIASKMINPVRGERWNHRRFDSLPKKYAELGI